MTVLEAEEKAMPSRYAMLSTVTHSFLSNSLNLLVCEACMQTLETDTPTYTHTYTQC